MSTQQNLYAKQEIIARCTDLNLLAGLAIPHIVRFPFPPMFLYFWLRCTTLAQMTSGFPQLALGIPRGHAKTAFLKLLVLFIILLTQRKFILVVCASSSLAEAIIRDIVDMLNHPHIVKIFGAWDEDCEIDRQELKIFRFRGREIILKGVGYGSSVRGMSEKMCRPDVIICDDAQTRDCAMSVAQANEFAAWFYGTLMKVRDPEFCFYLYVGNIYPKLVVKPATATHGEIYGCLLKNLKLSPDWESIVVGAILSDGQPLWPALHSLEKLLAEYRRDTAAGQEDTFLAEVMNDDEAYNSNLFDETKVKPYPYDTSIIPQGAFLMIDPSLGKSTSDAQIVGEFHIIDGNTCLVDVQNHQVSAPQLVRNCIDWCINRNIPAIAVESYAYQATLGQWFEKTLEDEGILGIQILLVSRGRASKNSAIKSMLKEVMDEDLLLAPKARSYLYSEIRTWDQTKSNNVDNTLDVASYGNMVAQAYPREIEVDILAAYHYSHSGELIDVGMQHG